MLVDDVFYQNGMLVDVSGQVRTDGLAPKRAIDVHSGSVSVGKERSLWPTINPQFSRSVSKLEIERADNRRSDNGTL